MDSVVSVDVTAFHAIRPHDVGCHQRQRAVDIACIEGRVTLNQRVVLSLRLDS